MNVYFLLDRSGSMETLWKEALGSINGYVKGLPKETNIYLAAFDSVSYDILRNTTAGEFRPLSNDDAAPRGVPPLFDAAYRTMQRALEDNAERTVFVTMTDGEENSSTHFRQHDVKSMVKKFEEKKWEVIFLGANFDKVGDVASSFGVQASKWTNITPVNLRATMDTFAVSSASYAMTGASINYTEEDKKKATT